MPIKPVSSASSPPPSPPPSPRNLAQQAATSQPQAMQSAQSVFIEARGLLDLPEEVLAKIATYAGADGRLQMAKAAPQLQAATQQIPSLLDDVRANISSGDLMGALGGIDKLLLKFSHLSDDPRVGEMRSQITERALSAVRSIELRTPIIIAPRSANANTAQESLRVAASVLKGCDLSGVNLDGGFFQGCDLRGINLSGARLRGANFYGANLNGARLDGADMTAAYFTDASLVGANMKGATLHGAVVLTADLRRADLEGANAVIAQFVASDLSEANLQSADLRGADFKNCNLANADIRGANCADTYFGGAHLDGLRFDPLPQQP